MEQNDIIREYICDKPKVYYPFRIPKHIFDKIEKLVKTDVENEFDKWLACINYNTNRKIKFGSKLHTELSEKFYIKIDYRDHKSLNRCVRLGPEDYPCITEVKWYKFYLHVGSPEYDKNYVKDNRPFINNYNLITELLFRQVDIQNEKIDKENKLIEDIRSQINKLEKWSDFVEFEGKKYGIYNKIRDYIHVENDCFGEMKCIYLKYIPSQTCNIGSGSRIYKYICNKCNYKNTISDHVYCYLSIPDKPNPEWDL